MTDTHLAILLDRFVRRLHVALRRKAPDFDKARVGPGGAIILLTLDDLGSVPLSELTHHLVRDKSQMTREVRALESKGLIERAQSDQDLRVSVMSLTEKGQSFVADVQRALAETIDEVLHPLSDDRKRDLTAILQSVDALSASDRQKP
ncbi:MAG: MarR family transcriptional regulator [Pseudomonadota bacterium]